jgi:tetratricopeptide (TPR) repeat protein
MNLKNNIGPGNVNDPGNPLEPSNGPLGWELHSSHSGPLLRLNRLLGDSKKFNLILTIFNDPVYRDRLMNHLERMHGNIGRLTLDSDKPLPLVDFESALHAAAQQSDALCVVDIDVWLTGRDGKRNLQGLNAHRESIARTCPRPLLLWLTEDTLKTFAYKAPDLWAWRTAVLDFCIEKEPPSDLLDKQTDPDVLIIEDKLTRIEQIETALTNEADLTSRQRASLMMESGRLNQSIGNLDRASELFTLSAQLFNDLNDRRHAAIATGDIARIKLDKGDVDAALKLHQERLEVFDALGDRRERAVTLGDIARIKVSKGDVDAALKLHQEMLEVFQNLGDLDGIANTLWSMAHIDIAKQDHRKAYERLSESYRINLKLGRLDGICFVGIDLGKILCDGGRKDEGLNVLKRSRDGFVHLGQQQLVKQIDQLINTIEDESS